jgi:hypothetical protein
MSRIFRKSRFIKRQRMTLHAYSCCNMSFDDIMDETIIFSIFFSKPSMHDISHFLKVIFLKTSSKIFFSSIKQIRWSLVRYLLVFSSSGSSLKFGTCTDKVTCPPRKGKATLPLSFGTNVIVRKNREFLN